MTTEAIDSEDGRDSSIAPAIVSLADFGAVDLEGPVRGAGRCDAYALANLYGTALRDAEQAGREPDAAVYRLLNALLDIHLNPRDRGSVWVAKMTTSKWRTAVAADFHGEQSAIIAQVAPKLGHPGVRARLADIAYTNDRRLGTSADVAVQAYRECVEGLFAGVFTSWHGTEVPVAGEAVLPLHRLLQVMDASTKKAKRPDWVRPLVRSVLDALKDVGLYPAFAETAELGLRYELFTAEEIVDEAEAFAADAPVEIYPEAVKRVWLLAGRMRAKLNDRDGEVRCQIGAFEWTLAMREGVRGSPGAEASWIRDALIELRRIPGKQDQEIALEIELRRLQRASLDKMGTVPLKFDVSEERAAVAKYFDDLLLPESLRQFALLERSADPEALRREAMEMAQTAPVMAMMGVSHIDADGRTLVKSPGAPATGEPEEGWFDHMIARSESIRRHQVVAGLIEPARTLIYARFGIEERDIGPIIHFSPVVPAGQKPLLVLGFTRFFQGDLMSAAHLVIPQLEPIVRQILTLSGHNPSKLRDDGTEEDFALSGLFDRFAEALAQVLGKPMAEEMERLFNRRPGPALRHEFAHGQIGAGACFHPEVYYAVWLIYRLCYVSVSVSVAGAWDDVVAPGIAASS